MENLPIDVGAVCGPFSDEFFEREFGGFEVEF